jgi:hypothetical protein
MGKSIITIVERKEILIKEKKEKEFELIIIQRIDRAKNYKFNSNYWKKLISNNFLKCPDRRFYYLIC